MQEHPAASAGDVIDLAGFIDGQPVGRNQIWLLLMCAAVLFVDGFDTQAIGYVAPELGREWHLSRGALGPVFSAGLLGLMLGNLLFSPLADRLGRKWIVIGSTIAFGFGTLVTAQADSIAFLLVVRFLTGIGLGGAMPNVIALTSEVSPQHRRATMVMAMFCGFSVGAALGGPIAAALISYAGWRSVFLLGGVAPLLLAAVLTATLSESVRFLALKGNEDARIGRILGHLFARPFHGATRFVVNEPRVRSMPVADLFNARRSVPTLLLWVVFFMSLLDLYFLSNWLPTVLNDLGASVSLAIVVGALLQVGGLVGTLALGRVIDRFSFRALGITYALATVAVAAIGRSGSSIVVASVAVFAAGFCIVGGQIAANAIAATFYPTAMRSTGVGWALGIGRIGSIIGPLVGGVFLSRHWATPDLFLAAAAPPLCAALAALALSRIVASAAPPPVPAIPPIAAGPSRP